MGIGFNEVYRHGMLFKKFYMVTHEPQYINKNMPYCNIHGHTHSTNYENKQYFNVSVENINYTPVEFKSIEKAVLEWAE